MSRFTPARALLVAAVAVAVALPAQPQPVSPPDPANASAPVPPLAYRSMLAGYRPFSDPKATPWRQANDTAAGVGGWRAYAREARSPDAAASAASAAQGGHDAHHRVAP